MEDRPSEIVLPPGAMEAREAARGYPGTDEAAAAALLQVIRRVDRQLPEAPELTGRAFDARRRFAAIADDLAVRKV